MTKPKYFVSITGNKYTFYEDKLKIESLISEDMTAEWLEIYRANPRRLLADLASEVA